MRTRNERRFAYSIASSNSSRRRRRRERTMCLRLDVICIRCILLVAPHAASTAVAASSRATNWKVIVRGLKDTADRRL